MWSNAGIRWARGGVIVLILALMSTATLMMAANSKLGTGLEREADSVKSIAMARLRRGPGQGAGLRLLLDLPQVTGVELFSTSGRRIAGLGEPLEIVGYRLEQDAVLQHDAADGSRYEVYWPPRIMESDFGVAVRLDAEGLREARRSLLVTVAGVQLVALTAAALVFSRRPRRP